MRWPVVLAVAMAAAVASPAPARAFDESETTPTGVRARLSDTTVELTARFVLEAHTRTVDSGSELAIPSGSLVTAATATIGGTSHHLSLDGAEHAGTMFDAIVAHAPASRRSTAILLSGGMDGMITLDVAMPAAGKVVLDLQVEMTSCFFRDRRYVLVPDTWFAHAEHHPPRVVDDDLDAACAPNGVKPEATEWLSFAAPELAQRPIGDARVGTFAGRLPLDHDHLARVEIDVSNEVARAPADLYTAIVIDHSRSLSADEIQTERALVAPYPQHVPAQSRVQVIAFARKPVPLLASWMPASSAAPRVDREIRALAPKNGSNIDDAIREAGTWLARAKGTRRVLLVTDDRFASRIDDISGEAFKALLPEHTLVHIAVVSAGSTGIIPTDREELGGLAQLTEGIAVDAGLDEHNAIDATVLVHPIGLDRITIKGPGWSDLGIGTCQLSEFSFSDVALREGQACTWWARGEAISDAITVEAFLWGHKISRTLFPAPTVARHLARELSATAAFSLDSDLKAKIDHAAFALNEVWSLMGAWGGEGGFADVELGGFGRSAFGGGCCDTGSSHDLGVGHSGVIGRPDVTVQLVPIVERCHATGALTIDLELTREEIVGVIVNAPKDTLDVQQCIEEGTWDLSLALPAAPWHTHAHAEFAKNGSATP